MTPHRFDSTILREYDIRGIVGKSLTEPDAEAVGRAFGTIVGRDGGRRVVVGYDGRASSPGLADALIRGLMSTGIEVIETGLGPTPMVYFAVKHLCADAGVQITGSHNPPEYNGIKLAFAKGPVYGQAIQEIGQIAAQAAYATGQGRRGQIDVRDAYVARLALDWPKGRALKVVWDCGNGATGEIIRMLTQRLPGTHHLLFDEIDGTFPNHHPDPTVPENLVDLIAEVKAKKADIGIGFDGDGDRIGAVDAEGEIVWADQLMVLYAQEVLASQPGATVIADVKCSQILFDEVARMGGKPLMWKTGHSLIKAKMAELKAPLAGEMAGHICFADRWYGFDCAIYCAVRLCGILIHSGKSLKELCAHLPRVFNTPETRFQVDESRKFQIVDEVKARLRSASPPIEINDMDGVRVKTAEGWWLLRASNTQDVLVARAEATSQAGLTKLKGLLIDQLNQSGVSAPDGF